MALKVAIINGKQPSGGVGGVSDADLSNLAINFHSAGVAKANDMKVAAQGTPNMTVKVPVGVAYVSKPDGTNIYVVNNDTEIASVAIGANASGNPRIDAVVLRIDLAATPNENADNIATVVVVAGTPAASPAAPIDSAIQSSVGSGNAWLRLANVTVANGASSITAGDIADARLGVEMKVLNGRLRFNITTSKLQFSHDSGATYKDVGAGGATPMFELYGNLAVGSNLGGLKLIPFALTIVRAAVKIQTAPTGADVIFDINKNGTSIWNTNQANRLKVLAGATTGNTSTFDTTSLAQDDYLTIDVDQIGSTVSGIDATVTLYCVAS